MTSPQTQQSPFASVTGRAIHRQETQQRLRGEPIRRTRANSIPQHTFDIESLGRVMREPAASVVPDLSEILEREAELRREQMEAHRSFQESMAEAAIRGARVTAAPNPFEGRLREPRQVPTASGPSSSPVNEWVSERHFHASGPASLINELEAVHQLLRDLPAPSDRSDEQRDQLLEALTDIALNSSN